MQLCPTAVHRDSKEMPRIIVEYQNKNVHIAYFWERKEITYWTCDSVVIRYMYGIFC